MWTHRSFMQLITSEIQKPSRCCGQSSQFVIASSWWWALSLQVSFINVYSKLIIDWPSRWFPEWVGDLESETGGRIGLWKVCERNEMSDNCAGKLEDMMDMQSMSFQVNFNFYFHRRLFKNFFVQVATIFAGIAVATSLLTIMCLMFMIFLKSTTVFHICGWMQILSGEDFTFADR